MQSYDSTSRSAGKGRQYQSESILRPEPDKSCAHWLHLFCSKDHPYLPARNSWRYVLAAAAPNFPKKLEQKETRLKMDEGSLPWTASEYGSNSIDLETTKIRLE
jgi:hypothetical protein